MKIKGLVTATVFAPSSVSAVYAADNESITDQSGCGNSAGTFQNGFRNFSVHRAARCTEQLDDRPKRQIQ